MALTTQESATTRLQISRRDGGTPSTYYDAQADKACDERGDPGKYFVKIGV